MQKELEQLITQYFYGKGYQVRQLAIDEFKEQDEINFAGRINIRVIKPGVNKGADNIFAKISS